MKKDNNKEIRQCISAHKMGPLMGMSPFTLRWDSQAQIKFWEDVDKAILALIQKHKKKL